jgi:DNA adenine methylase
MPPHTHYVEPYFGGGSVLLARDGEGVSEVANDLHFDLTTFWRVLASPDLFPRFQRLVEALPFSEGLFVDAHAVLDIPEGEGDPVQTAAAFFVRCRQSLAGRMKAFTGVTKTRTRRGMNNEVSAWLSAVEGLPAVHERLKRVLILRRPALDVIRGQDGPDTFFYCDPPYLPDTRASPGVYAHEMDEAAHVELLAALRGVRGKVALSGYPHPLYDDTLKGWRVVDFDMANHAAGGDSKRRMTERLWLNY